MKDSFGILNDIKIDLDEYEEVNLTDLEKLNMKKRVKNKIRKSKGGLTGRKVAAAAFIIAILGGVMLNSKLVWAQIDSIGLKIEGFFNREGNSLEGYKAKVIKSATDKEITISLNEVMLDDGQIVASLRIDSSKINRDELGIKEKGDLNIIPAGHVSVSIDGREISEGMGMKFLYNGDGTVDILMNEVFEEVDLNRTYNIKFLFKELQTQVRGGKNKVISGNWSIDFQASGKSMADKIEVIPINKEVLIKHEGDSVNILLKELRCSPYSVKLSYYEKRSKDEIFAYGFTLFDENGKEIHMNGGRGTGIDDSIYDISLKEEYIITKKPKKIRIVPYIYENKKMTFLEDKAVEVTLK